MVTAGYFLFFCIVRILSARSSAFVVPHNRQHIKSTAVLSGQNIESPADELTIAFTREKGKNYKIHDAVAANPILSMLDAKVNLVDLPCIRHAEGDDHENLLWYASKSNIEEFDYVIITSPEAAKVFGEAFRGDFYTSETKIAAVGKATKKALAEFDLEVDFVPSKATGETLAAELPALPDARVCNVLYPASAKAPDTIRDGLQAREAANFEMTRLNVYDTVPATFTDEQMNLFDDIDVACFGSPSAVKAWLQNVDVFLGTEGLSEEERRVVGNNGGVMAACIGTTTARECLESGRWEPNHIYYPKNNPGVDSWAASAAQALGDAHERKFWGGGW